MKFCLQVVLKALLAVSLTSCGLIAYPTSDVMPPGQMKRVLVRDQVTQRPVSDATVVLHVQKTMNYMRFHSPLASSRIRQEAALEGKTNTLYAAYQGGGVYEFNQQKFRGWAHVIFPFGLPLGAVLYHYHHGWLVVKSPYHQTIRVTGWAQPVNDTQKSRQRSPFASWQKDSLVIDLPRN